MNPIVKKGEREDHPEAGGFLRRSAAPLCQHGRAFESEAGDAIELSRLADIAMTALKLEEKQGHRSSDAALSGERRI